MDVVLEVFDTFIADHVFAYLVPRLPAPYDFPASAANATSGQTFSTWTYKPSTRYLTLEPYPAAYESAWDRDHLTRQYISLFLITWLFGLAVYFIVAALSYTFIFDKRTFNHPRFLKNQVRQEIISANCAMPIMAIPTAAIFVLEVRGYGKLYDTTEDGPGLWYNFCQFPIFLLFTDFCIYWIHRWEHHPALYKHLHKPHHKWIMPTPFASHAFHPMDGFAQSLPYHVFPFIFPLQKLAYVALFVFVNLWAVMIHDGEYLTDNPVVNGAACHSLHHSRFEVNYGQFFTGFDRIGGTYRRPEAWMFEKDMKMSEATWKKEIQAVDALVAEVEGTDDRTYRPADTKKTK